MELWDHFRWGMLLSLTTDAGTYSSLTHKGHQVLLAAVAPAVGDQQIQPSPPYWAFKYAGFFSPQSFAHDFIVFIFFWLNALWLH